MDVGPPQVAHLSLVTSVDQTRNSEDSGALAARSATFSDRQIRRRLAGHFKGDERWTLFVDLRRGDTLKSWDRVWVVLPPKDVFNHL